MAAVETASSCPLLGLQRIGTALAAIALVVPPLSLPACFAFAAIVAGAGWLSSEKTTQRAAPRRRHRRDRVDAASEDSFPASDPPSWTPVAGTGTRH